jgi:hypothetical protein
MHRSRATRGDLDGRDPVVVAGMRQQPESYRIIQSSGSGGGHARYLPDAQQVVDSESREEHLWNHSKHDRLIHSAKKRDARLVTYQ